MPFFSMIVACHNSRNTITRLLDSIVDQGFSKDELEVILCDDCSDDGWQEEAIRYKDRLNMVFCHTPISSIHCPGNTRRIGLSKATGDWICFADHDDMYEKGALTDVRHFILDSGEKYCVCTIMQSWNEDTDTFFPFIHKQAWLHGKFYHRENLIEKHQINFKKDLRTHEDIYFNSCVLSALYGMGIMDFTYFDSVTYRWVENPDSITRNYEGERGYLHENFDDYIDAAAEPFWEGAVSGREIHINQVMMALLHSYFYYEAVSYLYGAGAYRDNLTSVRNFIGRISAELKMSADDIVNYIYSDPVKFACVRSECQLSEGFFIEKTSFRDFTYRIMDINALGRKEG